MQTKSILKGALALSATLALTACPETPITPTPSVEPTVSAEPSVAPTAVPTVEATVAPTAEPTVAPTLEPTVAPTAEASVEPSVDPSAEPSTDATPVASSTSDISVVEKTTFNGKIFDDTNAPLDGVTVKAKSLNSSNPWEGETITAGGAYAFNDAPSGIQIELLASKSGFTTRRRVEVLKSNKQGDPNANRYDFGNDANVTDFSAAYQALSDLPEVVKVSPGRNAAGVDAKTSFVLTFSEPMDKKTVEDTFSVFAFNNRKFTVDNGNSRAVTNTVVHPDSLIKTFAGGTKIWDKDAFDVSWNSDDTEVTLSFKEEKLLPTDKDSNLVADYQVAFNSFDASDRVIKDKSGISRNKEHFKLTDGNFEESYKFSIQTDEAKPELSSIIAQTDENQGTKGDSVWARFSERMIIYTRDVTIAGGMDNANGSDSRGAASYPTATGGVAGNQATAMNTAENYDVRFIQTGGTTKFAGKWSALGGTAVFDTNDVTHKTVILLAPKASGAFGVTAATANADTITVTTTYTDGTSVDSTLTLTAATFAEIDTQLETLTSTATFTVTEGGTGAVAGTTEANDTITITLAAGAKNVGNTKTISAVKLTGGTGAAKLGITAATPYWIYPGSTAGSFADLYDPGDTVRVTVGATVQDPAGNTMDTSRDDASANAS